MLQTLRIKNYALITEIEVGFSPGLVIITGETGAGKSIIIDALGLVLGARASTEVVRTGSDKTIVEAVFRAAGNKKLHALCDTEGLDWSDELLVRREVSAKGQSRCFVNDSPVSLAVLKQAGEFLVDLHGQHEHQSLLRSETHAGMLDDAGGLDGLVQEYRKEYSVLKEKNSSLQDLRLREKQLQEKREWHEFQIREIDAVGPKPGEEDSLEKELRILENSERLFGSTSKIYELLYDGDQSIHDQLVVARNQLQALSGIDDRFGDAEAECGSAEAIVNELAKFIQSYNARVEFNPERLEELRDRLGKIALLKKKYGGSLETVLEHRARIGEEAALAEHFDQVMNGLSEELSVIRRDCGEIAGRLSAKRHEVARKLEKGILAELKKLGIENGCFQTEIEQTMLDSDDDSQVFAPAGTRKISLNSRGYDGVEFLISTNVGEEPKPLSKVASGGEVSRIMLALKSILAKADRLPVLIFDEIDVGVSGRIAQAVGISLKSLSTFHQVIAITHLPQIAGLADSHFAVSKTAHHGRATTMIRKLTLDEQVAEVARLMSGAEVTEAGLAGARELMGIAGGRKK